MEQELEQDTEAGFDQHQLAGPDPSLETHMWVVQSQHQSIDEHIDESMHVGEHADRGDEIENGV